MSAYVFSIPEVITDWVTTLGAHLYIILSSANTKNQRNGDMEEYNFVKNTLDQIPKTNVHAKRIVKLVKEGGRITGYQLSDNFIVKKQQAVNMAKHGQIAGVSIAHRGDAEYLKAIPDGSENNLENVASLSPDTQGS